MSELRLVRLDVDAPLPARAHPDDAGLDLHANLAVELRPFERRLVPTGIAVELPPACVGLIVPRSGLAVDEGITVLNAPGVVDPGYRGELKVLLINLDPSEVCRIEKGQRIAQMLTIRLYVLATVLVDSLTPSARDDRGFGSTGR